MLKQFEDRNRLMHTGPQRSRITKILVPVDGSECSINAVEFAVDLAAKYNSELCLVHIISTSYWNYCLMDMEGLNLIPVHTMREMEDEGESLLLSFITSVKEAGIKANAQLDYGRPANKIVKMAKEENFDLIVMGSKDHGAIARFFLGSVSNEVIHNAPCPVLIIKEIPKNK